MLKKWIWLRRYNLFSRAASSTGSSCWCLSGESIQSCGTCSRTSRRSTVLCVWYSNLIQFRVKFLFDFIIFVVFLLLKQKLLLVQRYPFQLRLQNQCQLYDCKNKFITGNQKFQELVKVNQHIFITIESRKSQLSSGRLSSKRQCSSTQKRSCSISSKQGGGTTTKSCAGSSGYM
jgi:hypothetical protein